MGFQTAPTLSATPVNIQGADSMAAGEWQPYCLSAALFSSFCDRLLPPRCFTEIFAGPLSPCSDQAFQPAWPW